MLSIQFLTEKNPKQLDSCIKVVVSWFVHVSDEEALLDEEKYVKVH